MDLFEFGKSNDRAYFWHNMVDCLIKEDRTHCNEFDPDDDDLNYYWVKNTCIGCKHHHACIDEFERK